MSPTSHTYPGENQLGASVLPSPLEGLDLGIKRPAPYSCTVQKYGNGVQGGRGAVCGLTPTGNRASVKRMAREGAHAEAPIRPRLRSPMRRPREARRRVHRWSEAHARSSIARSRGGGA